MRRAITLLGALVSACEAPRAVVEVPLGDHLGAALISIETDRGARYVALEAGADSRFEEELTEPEARLTLSYFEPTLEAFGLVAGPLSAAEHREGEPLPPATRSLEATVSESGAVTPWATVARTDAFDAILVRPRACPELVSGRPIPIPLPNVLGIAAIDADHALLLGRDARGDPQLLAITGEGSTSTVATPGLRPSAIAGVGSRIFLGGISEGEAVIAVSSTGDEFRTLHVLTEIPSELEAAPEEGPEVLYVRTGSRVRRVDATLEVVVAELPRGLWTHVGPGEILANDLEGVRHFANGRSVNEAVFIGTVDHVTALLHSFAFDRSFAGSSAGRLAAWTEDRWEIVAETPLVFEMTGLLAVPEGLLLTSYGGEITELELPSARLCAETSWKLGGDANVAFISRSGSGVFVAVQDKRDRGWSVSRAERIAPAR